MEIWKDIEGYEGRYQVSNDGRVKSLGVRGKILSPCFDTHGYYIVSLSKNGIVKKQKIHRIVAKSFIKNPDSKREVDHINTIRTDNRVANLRWATTRENANNPLSKQHCAIKKRGENNPNYGKKRNAETRKKISFSVTNNNFQRGRLGVLNEKSIPVVQLSKNLIEINIYDGINEAERITGIHNSNIVKVCKGMRQTAGGYTWRYKSE